MRLVIFKGVFHPGFFRSTNVFAAWIETQSLINKKILEIGAGSGLISLVAARQGAIVTAIDINEKAVENTKLNASKNNVEINVYHSDLFNAVTRKDFDLVFINPPYYPKTPLNDYEKAWYCGEGFDYFEKLFMQLNKNGLSNDCFIILSDTCDLPSIAEIAARNSIALNEIFSRKVSDERLMIYKTASIDPA